MSQPASGRLVLGVQDSSMKVSAWFGSGSYGVRVGIENRDRYFKSSWESIIVAIDKEEHTFKLANGFWNHCPEFRESKNSPIIKNWLLKYKTIDWPKYQTPQMELVPIGERSFQLLV